MKQRAPKIEEEEKCPTSTCFVCWPTGGRAKKNQATKSPSYGPSFLFNISSIKKLDKIVLENLKLGYLPPEDETSFLFACGDEHASYVKFLLTEEAIDPSVQNNFPIRFAAFEGNLEIFKLLISDPRVDPSAFNNQTIVYAVLQNHKEIIKLLLNDPRVDPSISENFLVRYCSTSSENFLDIIEMLFQHPKVVSTSQNLFSTIIKAFEKKNYEIVKFLLLNSFVDPSEQKNKLTIMICDEGLHELLEVILKDSRINPFDQNCSSVSRGCFKQNFKILHLLLSDRRAEQHVDKKFLIGWMKSHLSTKFESVYPILCLSVINFSIGKANVILVGLRENNFNEPKEIWELIIKKLFQLQIKYFFEEN